MIKKKRRRNRKRIWEGECWDRDPHGESGEKERQNKEEVRKEKRQSLKDSLPHILQRWMVLSLLCRFRDHEILVVDTLVDTNGKYIHGQWFVWYRRSPRLEGLLDGSWKRSRRQRGWRQMQRSRIQGPRGLQYDPITVGIHPNHGTQVWSLKVN